jgi:hypothetical protein
MLDLSGVSDRAILSTITKYEGILAGTRKPIWRSFDCQICVENQCWREDGRDVCCLVEDRWCDIGMITSKLCPSHPQYNTNAREFLELVKTEGHRRGLWFVYSVAVG